MDKTTVKAEFVMEGPDLEPENITKLIGIDPDEAWKKGDSIPNKQIIRRSGCWSISTNFEESFDVNAQLLKITNILQSKKEELQNIRETYHLEYALIIIIKIEDNMKPAIHFDEDLIEFAHQIKAEIGIDLYIF